MFPVTICVPFKNVTINRILSDSTLKFCNGMLFQPFFELLHQNLRLTMFPIESSRFFVTVAETEDSPAGKAVQLSLMKTPVLLDPKMYPLTFAESVQVAANVTDVPALGMPLETFENVGIVALPPRIWFATKTTLTRIINATIATRAFLTVCDFLRG